jgi:hypothetical protein
MKDFLFTFSPTATFFEELKAKIDNREIGIVDAAAEDDAPARAAGLLPAAAGEEPPRG